MDDNRKHPILANGEYYIQAIEKKNFSSPPKYPHEYEEAKSRLAANINDIQSKISEEKKYFVDEKVICIRLEPKFEAKSYEPGALLSDSKMKMIGGRKYKAEQNTRAKLYFVKTTNDELEKLKGKMQLGTKDHVNTWRNQICSIRSIDLLDANEKVMGFEPDWKEGIVEMILHPLGSDSTENTISSFISLSGISANEMAIRVYEDGLTFICAHVNREIIDEIKNYNPLRSIKPLDEEINDPFRINSMTAPAPKLPEKIYRSNVKVGVFDGGVEENVPLLDNYVRRYDLVKTAPTQRSSEHGTGVCGAVLYGELSGYSHHDTVKNPAVFVESFRVLPAERTGNSIADFEMYNTIDIIENVVKSRRDIKVFSLSFGPRGAIVDDELNRFTYALDRLTYEVEEGEDNPLFCIAVGNDGDKETPADRVQAPSDMVNGLAVGAYTFSPLNEKVRAAYSCLGPGREGAKIKPDVLEFGGSQARPFVIVLPSGNQLGASAGTSLAAPVVAGKIGTLMANSAQIVPHLGRTLLIHHAEGDGYDGDLECGFGYVPEDVTEVLNCTDKSVTILYSGEMNASTSVKLPIFLPGINTMKGNVNIRWTISTVVNPNANDPDAYTNNCIEDTLYPNEMVYSFRQGKKVRYLNLADSDEMELAVELLRQGYTKSTLPVSKPAKKSFREEDLRKQDYKWDTIIRKKRTMRATSLLNPFLSLHAIGRDKYEHERVRYNVVITVDVPSYKGSLYDTILQKYNHLIPLQVQNINRVMAPINNG